MRLTGGEIVAEYLIREGVRYKDLQMEAYGPGRALSTDFLGRRGAPYSPNLAEVARAFGAYGERISRADEVEPALERAFASRKPAVVEALVNREHPYTGSPSQGWWDVPVPAYLTGRRAQYERLRAQERLG